MSTPEDPTATWHSKVTHALADSTLFFQYYKFGDGVPAWRVSFAPPISSTVVMFVSSDEWLTIQTEPVEIPGLTLEDLFRLHSRCMLAKITKDPHGFCAQLDIHKLHVSSDSIMMGLGAALTLLGEMHRERDARATPPA